jgi:Xaa-Pro aminopeptidase
MEYERAKLSTWVDEVYAFSRRGSDGDVLKAENYIEAFKRLYGDAGRVALPFSSLSHSSYQKFSSVFGCDKIVDGDKILVKSRMVKTSFELEKIKEAVRIVEDGVNKGIESVDTGVSELDIAYVSHCYMKKIGADKVYDDLIVASGHRSSLPHGRATDKVVEVGDVVTLDFVASFEGYYGDETRTVFYGSVGEELRKIYEVVLEALLEATDSICEGVVARDVDSKVRSVIEKAGYGEYFTHSTGHGIGLEVHEGPRLSSRDDTVLESGMVVTVEPGIYIPELGGVRIEDDVVVTSNGRQVLTSNTRDIIVL